jgi:hypothetical protein
MTWSLYRWTWLLESPLYVGMPPAGGLNRCRLYVPARALWGAITAELARAKADNSFPDYQKVGDEIGQRVRFTYLFPAEKDESQWHAWLPRYEQERGLVWQREDDGSLKVSDREFRMRLLSTRPSTAIDPSSDTAAEGSLRETECINTTWREFESFSSGPVGFLGYLFLRSDLDEKLREALLQLQMITVGGDTRYGLGRLRQIADMAPVKDVFGYKVVDLSKVDPLITADRVLGHAELKEDGSPELRGAMELLRGWDYGRDDRQDSSKPLWVPGSASNTSGTWDIDASGHWHFRTDRNS